MPSALSPPVHNLMKLVLGSDRTIKIQLDDLGVDLSNGVIQLSDGQLSAAHGVLERISVVLNKGVEIEVGNDACADADDATKAAEAVNVAEA